LLGGPVAHEDVASEEGAVGESEGTPQVFECHRITGEDCFLMRVNFASVKALEQIIDRFLPYAQTTTSIVQSSPVPLRSPPLPV
jgi:Lrp/AsnC family transcriptional regulator, leucine-responsive regulatory protein